MIDAVLGLIIATIATSALTLAVEFTEASFARKEFLDTGLSEYERNLLEKQEFSVDEIEEFKEFLGSSEVKLYK